mmetsp:Transcript_24375/g.64223  ORF Transcript_24375/g.64223 Transcript_24375/m.64223 type:complete len:250 (-) Transcript_24375:645-1394(-)
MGTREVRGCAATVRQEVLALGVPAAPVQGVAIQRVLIVVLSGPADLDRIRLGDAEAVLQGRHLHDFLHLGGRVAEGRSTYGDHQHDHALRHVVKREGPRAVEPWGEHEVKKEQHDAIRYGAVHTAELLHDEACREVVHNAGQNRAIDMPRIVGVPSPAHEEALAATAGSQGVLGPEDSGVAEDAIGIAGAYGMAALVQHSVVPEGEVQPRGALGVSDPAHHEDEQSAEDEAASRKSDALHHISIRLSSH